MSILSDILNKMVILGPSWKFYFKTFISRASLALNQLTQRFRRIYSNHPDQLWWPNRGFVTVQCHLLHSTWECFAMPRHRSKFLKIHWKVCLWWKIRDQLTDQLISWSLVLIDQVFGFTYSFVFISWRIKIEMSSKSLERKHVRPRDTTWYLLVSY